LGGLFSLKAFANWPGHDKRQAGSRGQAKAEQQVEKLAF